MKMGEGNKNMSFNSLPRFHEGRFVPLRLDGKRCFQNLSSSSKSHKYNPNQHAPHSRGLRNSIPVFTGTSLSNCTRMVSQSIDGNLRGRPETMRVVLP